MTAPIESNILDHQHHQQTTNGGDNGSSNNNSDYTSINTLHSGIGNDNNSQINSQFLQTLKSNEEPLWTILPSYHMYNSIYRNIHLNHNDDVVNNTDEPPTYDASSSGQSSTIPSGSIPSNSTPPSLISSTPTMGLSQQQSHCSNPRFVVADEETNWQETILDNTHLLKNLTDTTNAQSNAIDIKIKFTKEICQINQVPQEIDPSLFEYKQGDYLNGYVLIKNTLDKPIPFEMFYLVFEGMVKIIDPKTKTSIHARNFLQMFDFSGSWNHAHINRLITEYENPYACPDMRDDIDGSFLSFGDARLILPNKLYKRFFTFKIPNFLLDTECSEHNLAMHVQLPPSLGCPTLDKPGLQKSTVKDFSMLDSTISYGVLARFIGRKSKYTIDKSLFNNDDKILINSQGDEFLILKEQTNFVRILQQSNRYNEGELAMKFVENKLMYNNLKSRLEEKIKFGNRLIKSLQDQNYDESFDMTRIFTQNEIEIAKLKQSYQHAVRDCKYDPSKIEYYNYSYILAKKSFAGSTKLLGTLQVSTPKKSYFISYIPPKSFRINEGVTPQAFDSLKLSIPINFKYSVPTINLSSKVNMKNFPEVKSIMVDLVVLTIKADKYPIPVEFHHDLIFHPENANSNTDFIDKDNFKTNVISEFQNYSNELNKIVGELGKNLRFERELLEDLKSLCQLQTKTHNLAVYDIKHNNQPLSPNVFNNIPWTKDINGFVKKLDLSINLESAQLKTLDSKKTSFKYYDVFNLVPNFQYCRMGRLYHLKITFGLSNNQYVHIKVPVTIQK